MPINKQNKTKNQPCPSNVTSLLNAQKLLSPILSTLLIKIEKTVTKQNDVGSCKVSILYNFVHSKNMR